MISEWLVVFYVGSREDAVHALGPCPGQPSSANFLDLDVLSTCPNYSQQKQQSSLLPPVLTPVGGMLLHTDYGYMEVNYEIAVVHLASREILSLTLLC